MVRNDYENAADEVAYMAGNLRRGLASLLQIASESDKSNIANLLQIATTLDKKSDKLVAMIEELEHDEELGSLDIEYLEDEDTKYTGAPCTENCTSCLDTTCIFHETNRDTDEYKELSRELWRRIAEAQ